MEFIKQNILFCPLDWGLGHASRSVPLIRHYIQQGHEVFIASSGSAYDFLKIEFPNLEFFELPSYAIKFGKNYGTLKLALRFFDFVSIRKNEKKCIDAIIETHKINLIISDNRYGAYSSIVKSVFITHQLTIQLPAELRFLSRLPNTIQKTLLSKFDEIWIPDYENPNSLSGNLSKFDGYSNVKFIGWQSRFVNYEPTNNVNGILAWVSGPEPQRSEFAEKLKSQLSELDLPATLVLGNPNQPNDYKIGKLKIINHLNSHDFNDLIIHSKWIICRSGYSSLMDLTILNKSALIVPCKGQSEQEYLAKYCHEKGYFLAQTEENLNISQALSEIANYKPPTSY